MVKGDASQFGFDSPREVVAIASSDELKRSVKQILVDPYLAAWQAKEQCTMWEMLAQELGLMYAVKQSDFDQQASDSD